MYHDGDDAQLYAGGHRGDMAARLMALTGVNIHLKLELSLPNTNTDYRKIASASYLMQFVPLLH